MRTNTQGHSCLPTSRLSENAHRATLQSPCKRGNRKLAFRPDRLSGKAYQALAALVPNVPANISWTLSLNRPDPDDKDGSALHQRCRELVAGWHPALRRIVDEAEVPATC